MGKVLAMAPADREAMSRAAHAKAACSFAIDGVAARLIALFGSAIGRAP
jgi:hypothetical protein